MTSQPRMFYGPCIYNPYSDAGPDPGPGSLAEPVRNRDRNANEGLKNKACFYEVAFVRENNRAFLELLYPAHFEVSESKKSES